MKIINVVGARPNLVKISPIIRQMKRSKGITPKLVHTGQHYDYNMSKIFFKELQIPRPDVYLGVGSGSHARQTAKVMEHFEKVLLIEKPGMVLVVGDVNSTLACSLAAAKLNIKIAHVEAGLRSFDHTMPEEINRLLTDSLSEFFFTTSKEANKNLINEGHIKDNIFFVGNVMIDTLVEHREKIASKKILAKFKLEEKRYVTLTLHRPSNVNCKSVLKELLKSVKQIQKRIKVVFCLHPRTLKAIENFGFKNILCSMKKLHISRPLGYIEFLSLLQHSNFVMTDSGGIQEETTFLKVPCLTLRENTERPVTISLGTNILVGTKSESILPEAFRLMRGQRKDGRIPELWEGKAAERIVKILEGYNGEKQKRDYFNISR